MSWLNAMRRGGYASIIGLSFSFSFSAFSIAADVPAVPVSTVVAERRPVTQSVDFVGRIEAPERVEIRARVKGVLDDVSFREGDTVAVGAPLYKIEKSLFQADVEQAQGALERVKAELTLATIQRQRAEDLVARNAGTVVARDQAVAQEAQTKGGVTSAQASLQTAMINLGYTDIYAPIAGRIGRTAVTKGNIVGPDSGVLATLVSQDLMHVTFPVSQRDLSQARKTGEGKAVEVRVRFSDGTLYDQVGKINFVDVTVDRLTDTVVIRADIPNPSGTLIDGQLVKVELQTGKPQERVLVPQIALIADQAGIYVFVVEDGKAVVKRIKTAGESGASAIIADGLSGGEQVVTEGFQSLRAGTPVRATLATIIGEGK
ncbi:efflux RND transporter periplasmic adaptor subunit [Labrys sp. 22185]|uniref:efflux RND transporter periplasmic adaptor subunit n=1 Tax=Labrys sp. 22185 TaxID=3453888 RepID=UPI003F86DB27